MYDLHGIITGRLRYCDQTVTFVPSTSTATQGDTDTPHHLMEDSENCSSEQPENVMAQSEIQTTTQSDLLQEDTLESIATSPPMENSSHSGEEGATREVPVSHIHTSLERLDEGLNTSLANSIKKLLPDISLTEFDTLRFRLKEALKRKSTVSTNAQSKYKLLATEIGTTVLSKKTDLDEQVDDFERKHYQQHSVLPTKSTNPIYRNLMREKILATTINF